VKIIDWPDGSVVPQPSPWSWAPMRARGENGEELMVLDLFTVTGATRLIASPEDMALFATHVLETTGVTPTGLTLVKGSLPSANGGRP
jgi:hypothetical protein